MVRCQNPARAGPFGGCVPVQMAGTAGNATDAAAAVSAPANAASAAAAVGGSGDASATTVTGAAAATGTQLVNSAKFRRVTPVVEEDDEEFDEEWDI